MRAVNATKIFGLLFTLGASPSFADLVLGELKFDAQPPTAAVLFTREPDAVIDQLQVDQKDRQFSSFMGAASTGADIIFNNSDKARHNLYANSFSTGTRFDVGLIPAGEQVTIKLNWPEDTIIRVGCAIHSQMETYVANVRSSHVTTMTFKEARTRRRGGMDDYGGGYSATEMVPTNEAEFKLRLVPSELQTFTLLAPYYQPLTFTLKLGEDKRLDFTRDGVKRGVLHIRRSQ